MQYLTPESLRDPEVKKAARSLREAGLFDIEDTERKRRVLTDLLEPDDAEGYDALQREIDEVFYSDLL